MQFLNAQMPSNQKHQPWESRRTWTTIDSAQSFLYCEGTLSSSQGHVYRSRTGKCERWFKPVWIDQELIPSAPVDLSVLRVRRILLLLALHHPKNLGRDCAAFWCSEEMISWVLCLCIQKEQFVHERGRRTERTYLHRVQRRPAAAKPKEFAPLLFILFSAFNLNPSNMHGCRNPSLMPPKKGSSRMFLWEFCCRGGWILLLWLASPAGKQADYF